MTAYNLNGNCIPSGFSNEILFNFPETTFDFIMSFANINYLNAL